MSPIFAIAIALATTPPARIDPAEFRSRFEVEWCTSIDATGDLIDRAAGYRYVFIGGLGSDGPGRDFAGCVTDLRRLGVPRSRILILTPSADEPLETNARFVGDSLKRFACEGPQPLVIVAQSRGACEALRFGLDDPAFTTSRIAAMFLVQAPFGGSGLADYAMRTGPEIDNRIEPRERFVARVLGRHERSLVDRGRHRGVQELTHDRARAYWARMVCDYSAACSAIGDRVYFVEAETQPERLRIFMRSTGAYLRANEGPNDGIVARGDQCVAGVGTSLGIFDLGHADLTRKHPGNAEGKRTRAALMRTIVGSLPPIVACN